MLTSSGPPVEMLVAKEPITCVSIEGLWFLVYCFGVLVYFFGF